MSLATHMNESVMTDVRVALEAGAGLERRMRVEVPAVRIEEAVEARLKETGRTMRLKGFRPGKVPPHVLRQRFGLAIREEVLQEVVQSSYSEAIVREKLRPVGSPRIENQSSDAGRDLSYTAVFEVYPEFSVAGLDDIVVEKPEAEVTDADIERTIERLRQQRGSWLAVERGAEAGDRVILDFEGRNGGQPIEGGSSERFALVLGEGRMLPDFESNVTGMKATERRSFDVHFPADYREEKLRGADVRFEVLIHEVSAPQLPEVDAAFVRSYEVESGDVTEFRRLVRENLEREAASRSRAEVRRQVMEHLLRSNPIELPQGMVAREAATLQAEGARNLGVKDPAQAPPVEAFEDVAKRRVRLGLIMGALIRDQQLRPDPARVDARLDELCEQYDQAGEVRRLYLQNPDLMAQIESSVVEEQAMAWLLERAKMNPRSVTFAEVTGG